MKQNFRNDLITALIQHRGFESAKNKNNNKTFNSKINILTRYFWGGIYTVELIDSENFTIEEIVTILQENRDKLSISTGGAAHFIFDVFIFKTPPEDSKLKAITAGQIQTGIGKNNLKCISVDLSTKQLKKHYKIPIINMGLIKTIKELLNN